MSNITVLHERLSDEGEKVEENFEHCISDKEEQSPDFDFVFERTPLVHRMIKNLFTKNLRTVAIE